MGPSYMMRLEQSRKTSWDGLMMGAGFEWVIKHRYEVHRLRKKKDLYNQDEYLNESK